MQFENRTGDSVMSDPVMAQASRFRSFWMAGFEGADHIDVHGNPLDMSACTGHAQLLDDDYERAVGMGLRTVRESVGWRVCSPLTWRAVDFTRMLRAADAAVNHGVQVIWTLMHYGTPPDVKLTDPDFASRFADFAGAAARRLRRHTGQSSVYNPINEIGFLAWAMSNQRILGGECSERDGYVVKTCLVRAALLSMDAIRAEDPSAQFIHIEPLIHVVAPPDQPQLAQAAADFCGYQWQVWDMLVGTMAPELGGTPAAVDWIGVNHYHDAQWEMGTGAWLDWDTGDLRRRSFSSMLLEAWHRYQLPLVVAETSHVGQGRARWLDDIASQTELAVHKGARVEGMCLYPAVDRPDWNNHAHWHRSGLWDAIAPNCHETEPASPTARRLAGEYADVLRYWQQRFS
jgi:beta-glucosidase/6-phospho-beta-glucosidase/beta-galactosidase